MIEPVTDISHPPMWPVISATPSIIPGNPNFKGFTFSWFPVLPWLSLRDAFILESVNLLFEARQLIKCFDVSVSVSGTEETTTQPLPLRGVCVIANCFLSPQFIPHLKKASYSSFHLWLRLSSDLLSDNLNQCSPQVLTVCLCVVSVCLCEHLAIQRRAL